jgi:prefoldin subunit 5
MTIERLEKEKKLMRDKIQELESEVKQVRRENREKDEGIKNLEHKMQIMGMEKDVRSSR